jgi:AcrR family transcriptional regulator
MPSAPFLVRQPRQARSRETMSQILDAAAQILETKTFEKLTIAEVVQKANTSVGAFYGRFKDKEALLQALDERFFKEFEEEIEFLLAPSNWAGKPISYIIRSATRLMVQTYSKDRGVLRSLNLKARLYDDFHFKKREQRAWNELFPLLQDTLLSHQDEISHPDPGLAIRLGFQQMFFTMREVLLWEPLREDVPYDNEELIAELTRAYLAYLGVQESTE